MSLPTVKNRQSKVHAKLLDKFGREIPKHEYDLDLGEEDFIFKFKNPQRDMCGQYTVVMSNDAGTTQEDINVNFLGTYNGT